MKSVIQHQQGWTSEDVQDQSLWLHQLTDAEVADVRQALQAAKAAGMSCATLTKASFPLRVVPALLAQVRDQLEHRLGFYVLRGLPVEGYAKDDLRLMYWGLGLHMGVAVSQSKNGDLLGDVKDFSVEVDKAVNRGYRTRRSLSFHTDTADVVALFVLATAKAGGLSKIASSLAVHDEIARRRPDLLKILYEPFNWSWMGQEAPGEAPDYPQPVFSVHEGYFSSRFIPPHIRAAAQRPGNPPLTAQQVEAIELIEDVASDPRFHFEMMFQPGDVQFLNNHVTYHSRTEFEDYPELERRRHLLRMWLSVENSRPLSPLMGAIYRDQRPGAVRGGFPSRVGGHIFETVVTTD